MSETTYPKLKYQGVEVKPGQHHTENPGFIYQRVNNPDDEAALEGDWHDSPRAAIDAFKANVHGAIEQRKTADPANAPAAGEGEVQPRATEEWPVESEKRRRR
jgi:hypothetical protein